MIDCARFLTPVRGARARCRAGVRLACAALALACATSRTLATPDPSAASPLPPLRIAFSQRMFMEVNENDARAAMFVWANTLGRERNIPVELAPAFLAGATIIAAALRNRTIDAITLPVDEYWAIRNEVALGPFIVGTVNGRVSEEYVVVVRKDRGFSSIGQLRGRTLAIYDNPRTCLSRPWLETLLMEDVSVKLPDFFGTVTSGTKLARVVLPVFFGQIDAALITREGLRVMSELNPQVGQQLQILAASAAMVPVVFCFRRDIDSPWLARLLSSISTIHETPAGRQTLTLFQSERLVECTAAEFASACELLDRHQQRTASGGWADRDPARLPLPGGTP